MNATPKDTNKVNLTLQVTEKERKDWKQYALNNDMTLTDTIKQAMQELFSKDKKRART